MSDDHVFLTKKITNEQIYEKLIGIEEKMGSHVSAQRWHNKAFYTGIGLLGVGFGIMLEIVLRR